MLASIFHRSFLRIAGILALIGFFSLAGGELASAQTVQSSSFNATTQILTITDTVGNTYIINLSAFSTITKTEIAGLFTPVGGTQMPATFVIKPLGNGNFTINGIPSNEKLVSCSASSSTTTIFRPPSGPFVIVPNYPTTCYVTDTPHSLLASIKQEVRSQSNEVIDTITDRLRTLSRDLAEGSLPAVQTPPGGTVILNDFSSNTAPKYNGVSAGSDDARWGVWGNASGSYLQNSSTANAFNGPSVVALAGIDYILDRRWIFGLSAGYTHADLTLSPSTINREVDGALVGPYAAYIVNPNWSVDALVNWTSLSNNITAPLPFPAGSYHANRWTAATNLNYFTTYNGFKLTGFGGYAYTWEGGPTNAVLPSSLANNVRFGVIRLGGEAAYDFGAWEPYVPLTFEYETTAPNDGTSRAALVPGVGLRYRWSDALTSGLLFEATELKSHTRDLLVSAHLRLSF